MMHELIAHLGGASFLATTLRVTTPLLLAALATMISDRAGVINIGVEGIMLCGAFAGVVASAFTGSAWLGLAGAIVGQVASVLLWEFLHEMAHRDAVAGPRIVKVINGIIGPWRNHLATWLTAIVTPLFSLVRLAEIAIYPFIAMLAGFPQYKAGDWVNVSRQKFSGLVGHDLIWCLYCDWMTGVWSLGSEMLRNVESFWCPIRFASDKKCANCTVDFPDVSNGWVDAKGNMAQVAQTVADFHGHGTHSWFGHPARLTVKGEPIQTVADANKEVKS